MTDLSFMQRALDLAAEAGNAVSPNPRVGAVLVQNQQILGEGFHEEYGGDHAEVRALKDAAARTGRIVFPEATLYCTLEPCCLTYPGKHQPPCTEALIKAQIPRVVIAQQDPHPKVAGKGIELLRQHGIKVDVGFLEEAARRLNPGYHARILRNRPFVRLKWAQSLDGRIAAAGGDARWITDEAARTAARKFRETADAILVGIETVLADDPQLTNRSNRGKNPTRIILDTRLRTPQTARMAAPGTWIVTGKAPDPEKAARMEQQGVEILPCPTRHGQIDLEALLQMLNRRQIGELMVEGGGGVLTSFIKANLYDRLDIFFAPLLIGCGIDAVRNLGLPKVAEIPRLKKVEWTPLPSGQMHFSGYREAACLPD